MTVARVLQHILPNHAVIFTGAWPCLYIANETAYFCGLVIPILFETTETWFFLKSVAPTRRRRATTKWVTIWDQFLIQKAHVYDCVSLLWINGASTQKWSTDCLSGCKRHQGGLQVTEVSLSASWWFCSHFADRQLYRHATSSFSWRQRAFSSVASAGKPCARIVYSDISHIITVSYVGIHKT